MINVLIVDDSLTTREFLKYIIELDPELRLTGEARTGDEAVRRVAEQRPDVVIMDIQMPGMDGYKATREIMETHPLPIIMYSSLVAPEKTENIFKAMQAGAVAVAQKPPGLANPESRPLVDKLLRTVKLMAEVKVVRRLPRKHSPQPARPVAKLLSARNLTDVRIIAIGASTGGPPVIQRILKDLPRDFPVPIAIVQHIAAGFLPGMLEWLSRETPLKLKIAETGDALLPGQVCFAPEDADMGISGDGKLLIRRHSRNQGQVALNRPISHLFQSVAAHHGPYAIGILLTGMGNDGAAGLRQMMLSGAQTLIQDRETSTVFGMPAEALKLDAAQYVLSPSEIATFLTGLARQQHV